MYKLFFIIGTSGSGKTSIIEFLKKGYLSNFKVIHLDDFPIPDEKELKEKYGGFAEWQKTHTKELVKKIKDEFLSISPVIIDGQSRPAYIEEAFLKNEIPFHEVILIDCADDERKLRLTERTRLFDQPKAIDRNLVNYAVIRHAEFLRNEGKKRGYKTFDNTGLGKEEMAFELLHYLNMRCNS